MRVVTSQEFSHVRSNHAERGLRENNSKLAPGNIASPAEQTAAASEWQTQDFQAAEPYPLPEVSEAIIEEYLQSQLTRPLKRAVARLRRARVRRR